MAPRRWMLLALSLASLVVLSYAAIAVAFSVPVDARMVEANRGAEGAPALGQRAVVAPIADPSSVARGAWLVVASSGTALPAQAEAPALVRALAFVPAPEGGAYANETLVLENLTTSGAGAAEGSYDLAVNLTETAAGRPGFFVKGAAERDARFVPAPHVVGQVARFESSTWMLGLVAAGSLGFVAPLVALVATHRATGRRGVPGDVPGPACPECRRPTAPGADFCMGCGAWLRDEGS